MRDENYIPKTLAELSRWFVHIEQVLRSQAKQFKEDTVQHIDRMYIADGINTIRMRDFPRRINLVEAKQCDAKIKEVGIDRNWLFQVCQITRYGEMWEIQYWEIMNHPQTWVNLYKKYIDLQGNQGSTLQESMTEEVQKIEAGLPKSFLKGEVSIVK